MEVRGIDHAADEVLATVATPEPASGVPQVSSQAAQEPVAAGDGEQDQDAPAEVDDDDVRHAKHSSAQQRSGGDRSDQEGEVGWGPGDPNLPKGREPRLAAAGWRRGRRRGHRQ